MDDENYLMPRATASKDDEPGLIYTPVLATDQDGKFVVVLGLKYG
jgi:hypothetical protein